MLYQFKKKKGITMVCDCSNLTIHPLTQIIKDDMEPALGVTEPGAIAYAVSTAKSYVDGEIISIEVASNSGIYKNAYTCGIPGSPHFGNTYAAAFGAVSADPSKLLECLSNISEEDNKKAEQLIAEGKVKTTMSEVMSRIHIVATVTTTKGTAKVEIYDSHTNIISIIVNGKTVFEKGSELCEETSAETDESHPVHKYTLEQIIEYASTVPADEIAFLMEAPLMNLELFKAAAESDRAIYLQHLIKKNGGSTYTDNEKDLANMYSDGAIEARVLGFNKPAMSITGSGSHGIITTMPLYAVAKIRNKSDEELTRAIAISFLVCMYIKEYSGKLSAFCGCGIAGGTGMACGLIYLWGGKVEEMTKCITNMAGSITGMICDGGNHGCVLKSMTACNMGFAAAEMAMDGVAMDSMHAICGNTPENTMRNMGLIASPGMVGTEKTILNIMQSK